MARAQNGRAKSRRKVTERRSKSQSSKAAMSWADAVAGRRHAMRAEVDDMIASLEERIDAAQCPYQTGRRTRGTSANELVLNAISGLTGRVTGKAQAGVHRQRRSCKVRYHRRSIASSARSTSGRCLPSRSLPASASSRDGPPSGVASDVALRSGRRGPGSAGSGVPALRHLALRSRLRPRSARCSMRPPRRRGRSNWCSDRSERADRSRGSGLIAIAGYFAPRFLRRSGPAERAGKRPTWKI